MKDKCIKMNDSKKKERMSFSNGKSFIFVEIFISISVWRYLSYSGFKSGKGVSHVGFSNTSRSGYLFCSN